MAEPTQEDRDQAYRLLDELTFGGHSEDGAASVLARALADQRAELEAGYRIGYSTMLDVRGMIQTWLLGGKGDARETLTRVAARLGLS